MGRKPTIAGIIDNEKQKQSHDEISRRVENEKSLQVSAALRCPKILTPLAKKEWRRVMKLYRQMEASILSDLDRNALIAYCEAVAVYQTAQSQWKKLSDKEVVASTNVAAQKVLDSIFNRMEKSSNTMFKFSEQLCLTPIGRAKMGLHMPKKKSKLEQMMEDVD